MKMFSQFILASFAVSLNTTAALAQLSPANIHPVDTACAMKGLVASESSYSPREFIADLKKADHLTNQILQKYSWLNRQLILRGEAHSFPLAASAEIQLDPLMYSAWDQLQVLRDRASVQRPNVPNLINSTITLPQIQSFRVANTDSDSFSEGAAVSRVLDMADPLILWMLEQPKASISHVELLRVALALYEKPTVALGVIGTIFYEEIRKSNPRDRLAVLSSKMQPLFDNFSDPYGANYHYWAYLNMALKGDRVQPALFSYAFENLYQKDYGDYEADQLGLKTGGMLRLLLMGVRSRCP